MENYEVKSVDFKHYDNRGHLYQLVHGGYQQINILESNKGVIRGKHYHKISKEAFFIVRGAVKVTLGIGNDHEEVCFGEGDFFEIKPYVMHSFYFIEDCIMVVMYDIPVDNSNGEMDIYSE